MNIHASPTHESTGLNPSGDIPTAAPVNQPMENEAAGQQPAGPDMWGWRNLYDVHDSPMSEQFTTRSYPPSSDEGSMDPNEDDLMDPDEDELISNDFNAETSRTDRGKEREHSSHRSKRVAVEGSRDEIINQLRKELKYLRSERVTYKAKTKAKYQGLAHFQKMRADQADRERKTYRENLTRDYEQQMRNKETLWQSWVTQMELVQKQQMEDFRETQRKEFEKMMVNAQQQIQNEREERERSRGDAVAEVHARMEEQEILRTELENERRERARIEREASEKEKRMADEKRAQQEAHEAKMAAELIALQARKDAEIGALERRNEALRRRPHHSPTGDQANGTPTSANADGSGDDSMRGMSPTHEEPSIPGTYMPEAPLVSTPAHSRTTPPASSNSTHKPSTRCGGIYGSLSRTARSTRTIFTAVSQDEVPATPEPRPSTVTANNESSQPQFNSQPPFNSQHGDALLQMLHGMQQYMQRIDKRLDEVVDSPKKRKGKNRRKYESPSDCNDDGDNEDDKHRGAYLRLVRAAFKKAFDLLTDDDIVSHETTETAQLLAHSEGLSEPDENRLRLDFIGNENSLWNRKVFDILAAQIILLKEEPHYKHIPDASPSYVRALVIGKYKRLRQKWRDALPKTNSMGVRETVDDAQRRLIEKAEEEGKRKRRDRRRMTKYERRVNIVEQTISIYADSPEDELAIWTWLKELLDVLGADGMSSDESTTENLETVYRVKRLPWRREMASNLEKLDRVRILDKTLFNSQGHRPARRIRGDNNPVSDRKPKQGLPKALYNREWLDVQTEDYRELTLSVSEKSFKWLNLMTTG